jgi:kynurenine 3-monooxygenase
MNCGFEDCGEFYELLNSSTSWDELLQSYQSSRKVNGDAIADLAIDNYTVMRASVLDQRFLTKKKMGFELEKKFPEKFIPRYSRVMFHHTPYAEALRLGEIQDSILEKLYENYTKTGEIDFTHASELIDQNI